MTTGNANSGTATVEVYDPNGNLLVSLCAETSWHEIRALIDYGIWCVPSAPNPVYSRINVIQRSHPESIRTAERDKPRFAISRHASLCGGFLFHAALTAL